MKKLIDVKVGLPKRNDEAGRYTITLVVKEERELGKMTIEEIDKMINYMPETVDDLKHVLFDYYESKITKENLNDSKMHTIRYV